LTLCGSLAITASGPANVTVSTTSPPASVRGSGPAQVMVSVDMCGSLKPRAFASAMPSFLRAAPTRLRQNLRAPAVLYSPGKRFLPFLRRGSDPGRRRGGGRRCGRQRIGRDDSGIDAEDGVPSDGGGAEAGSEDAHRAIDHAVADRVADG